MGGDKNERSFFDPKQAHAASRIVPLQWQLLLSKKKKDNAPPRASTDTHLDA